MGKRRMAKQRDKRAASRDSSSKTRSGKQATSKSKKGRMKPTIADLTLNESISEEIVVDNSESVEQEVETEKTEEQADYEQDFESVIPTESDLSVTDDTMSKL